MRRSRAITVGIALLVCAGCSTSTSTAPPPTPEPTAKPALSVPMYQRALTNAEKVLKPYVARVMNAKTVAAFDASRSQLAAAVVLEQKELAKITPPPGLAAAHPAVLNAFGNYAGDVSTKLGAAGSTKTSCGFPKSPTVRLYQAKTGVRTAFTDLAQSVQTSLGTGVKFGAISIPAAPKAPALIGARGTNGDVIQRSGPRGPGTLKISNSGAGDVVIVVTNGSPETPQASIYVRADKNATLNGIRGSYWVYFKGGTNWDSANNRFTENCSYQKYDNRFDGAYNWTISLAETPVGNATTLDTDAF